MKSEANQRASKQQSGGTRLSMIETRDVISKIPHLHNLLRNLASRNEVENGDNDDNDNDDDNDIDGGSRVIKVRKPVDDHDPTASFLFLSRCKRSVIDTPKEIEKSKNEEAYEPTVIEEQEEVEDLIKPLTNIEKRRRFALSLATLSSKPSKRVHIVTEGAIPALIDLSTLQDNTIERCCATAFAYLAKEASIRNQMLSEGAFTAIITLAASNSSLLVKEDCCRALCNLCCINGWESKILKDGPIPLIPSLAYESPQIQEICLMILLNLSTVSEKIPRIEEISESLHHIINRKTLTKNDEHLVISILVNLSAIRGNQLRFMEDGSLKFIERILKSSDLSARVLAAEALKNLTTCYRTRSKLIENNVIGTLLIMSNDKDEDVKLSCVNAFYNIARDNMCREKIVNANAVKVIIKMSIQKYEKLEMGRTAAKILRVLCSDRLIADRLVEDGIVKALISLLNNSQDDKIVYQYCAESICSLFQISDMLGRLVEQHAVLLLIKLCQTNTDLVTGEWCSFALYHLVTNKICPSDTLEHGVLPGLITLCEYSTERTIYFCSASLAYMTLLKTVDASGAIPLLVDILRSSPDAITSINCATALYHMVDSDENCELMLDSGVLPYIVALIKGAENIQITMKCAAILSRLSLQTHYQNQFAIHGVLQVLLELSSIDHMPTQRRVVIAISNLANNEELRLQIRELNAIPFLISLASKRDENLRRGCASIVCNLAYEAGAEKGIVEAGIVPTLQTVALITSDQILCKVICVKALVNLMADTSLYKQMVKDGCIWGFSTLGLNDDDELATICANALCWLSSSFAREMLDSMTTIKMVTKLINQIDVDLVRAGARTLTHMLLSTTDKDDAFRRHAVENMLRMSTCNDEEVTEICVLCLCLVSQSVSCRDIIVSSGMISNLDSPSIFNESRVCYAYLRLFCNLASDPSLRVKILDDKTIDRFKHITAQGDDQLDLAVMKAIYCVTCSSENVLKLAGTKILSIIQTIWDAEYEKSFDLYHHAIGIIYNLTTQQEVQGKLVSAGIVELVIELWKFARTDFRLCSLLCTAVCHLACGHVNTAKMVDDGCTGILCYMVKCKGFEECKQFNFPIDLYVRCAASMRNLLCVVSNQKAMVTAGGLECLILMAKEAENGTITETYAVRQKRQLLKGKKSGTVRDLGKSNDDRVGNKKVQVANALQNKENVSIYSDCASALRSMTFNKEVREKLISSGALDVILGDLKKDMQGDDIGISYELLSELEAESWENGSRGRQKEGRAAIIEPGPLFTDLLGDSQPVKLDIDIKLGELPKYHVSVILDEPKIEVENAGAAVLDISITDLSSYEENDDSSAPTTSFCSKVECEVNPDALSVLFRRDTTIKDDGTGTVSGDDDTVDKHHDKNGHNSSSSSSSNLPGLNSSNNLDRRGVNSLSSSINRSHTQSLPSISSRKSKTFRKTNDTAGDSNRSKPLVLRQNPDEKFNMVLNAIKAVKKGGKNQSNSVPVTEDVCDIWRKLSRF